MFSTFKEIHKRNPDYEDENILSTSYKRSAACVKFFLTNEKYASLNNTFKEVSNESNRKKDKSVLKYDKVLKNKDVDSPSTTMAVNGSNKLVIIGKVDFCLKIHKLYPNLNITWEIYGKLLKILVGKNTRENILILRSLNGLGPVIQSVYYDFNNILANFMPGTFLRAVGEFMNENRLRTFLVEQTDCKKWESEFSRIQNVTLFVLRQNKERIC